MIKNTQECFMLCSFLTGLDNTLHFKSVILVHFKSCKRTIKYQTYKNNCNVDIENISFFKLCFLSQKLQKNIFVVLFSYNLTRLKTGNICFKYYSQYFVMKGFTDFFLMIKVLSIDLMQNLMIYFFCKKNCVFL